MITPDQHGIDHASLSDAVVQVLQGLNDAGFRACLVGGAVRDLLLGQQPKDFDVATDAEPEQVCELFQIGRAHV